MLYGLGARSTLGYGLGVRGRAGRLCGGGRARRNNLRQPGSRRGPRSLAASICACWQRRLWPTLIRLWLA